MKEKSVSTITTEDTILTVPNRTSPCRYGGVFFMQG